MKIAISSVLINKGKKGDTGKYSDAFLSLDITIDEFASFIKLGYAFCAPFKNSKRCAANFDVSGYLAVDIDNKPTQAPQPTRYLSLEDAKASQFYRDYGAMIYTTPSHTKDRHRFRMIFELEAPIVNADDMRCAQHALAIRYGGDLSCLDACHIFYGSTGAEIHMQGKRMPKLVVDELVSRGKELEHKKHSRGSEGHHVTVQSGLRIKADELISVAGGGADHLKNLPHHTQVHCPHHEHEDKNPSAFTIDAGHEIKLICCMACKVIFYPEGFTHKHVFDYDWEEAQATQHEQMTKESPFYRKFLDSRRTEKTDGRYHQSVMCDCEFDTRAFDLPWIVTLSEPFIDIGKLAILPPQFASNFLHDGDNNVTMHDALVSREQSGAYIDDDLDSAVDTKVRERWLGTPGITYVKSPKGSGKTELMAEIVQYYKCHDTRKPRILLIGHRRALINGTAIRLGLTSYLKTGDGIKDAKNEPCAYYAICLDSMPKLLEPVYDKYDVIVVDESEQVFTHLLSDTMNDTRLAVLRVLRHYVRQAKHLFLLDADLSPLTTSVTQALVGDKPNMFSLLTINTYKTQGCAVNMYEHGTYNQIIGELVASLKRGEKCFLCANSKRLVDKVADYAAEVLPELKIMKVTGANSKDADVQNFIANIKTDAPSYDFIAVSPSLGTGVDMTFADDSKVFSVFGVFEARITTHFDMDQQLSRVRHPVSVNVWVSPEIFLSATEKEVIRRDIELMKPYFQEPDSYDADGNVIYLQRSTDNLYKEIYAAVSANRRASMNKLRDNFKALREHNGWTINEVEEDEALAKEGKVFLKLANDKFERNNRERLLNAQPLSYSQFTYLTKKRVLTEDEQLSINKFMLEDYFHVDATAELIDMDNNGKLRTALDTYHLLHVPDDELRYQPSMLQTVLGQEDSTSTLDADAMLRRKHALVDTLSAAGMLVNGNFDVTTDVEKATLKQFLDVVAKHRVTLEMDFKVKFIKGFEKNPVGLLEKVLGLIGLEKKYSHRDQSVKPTRYFYKLDAEKVKIIQEMYAQHMNTVAEAAWRKKRRESIGKMAELRDEDGDSAPSARGAC